MAVKPSECNGVTLATRRRIDAIEEAVDEQLRSNYQRGQAISCATGHSLSPLERTLLVERYARHWTITFENSAVNGETIAILLELPEAVALSPIKAMKRKNK